MENEPRKKRDAVETYNLAYQACGELWFAERITPTVLLVCERIHKKHTAVVGRAVKAWKEDVGFEDLLHRRRLEAGWSSEPSKGTIEPDFGQAVAELYRKAKIQVLQELQDRANELEQERLHLHEETAAARNAQETMAKEWAAYRLGTEREIETLRTRVAELTRSFQEQGRALERLTMERENLLLDAARFQEDQAASKRGLETLKEAYQAELCRWQERFDQDHDWHLRRIAEEKEVLRTGLQAQLEQLTARIQSLEPEAARAAELRWEIKLRADDIARLRQENASLQRRWLERVSPATGSREERLPGFWRRR